MGQSNDVLKNILYAVGFSIELFYQLYDDTWNFFALWCILLTDVAGFILKPLQLFNRIKLRWYCVVELMLPILMLNNDFLHHWSVICSYIFSSLHV